MTTRRRAEWERVTMMLPFVISRRLMKWSDHLHRSRAEIVTEALERLFAIFEAEYEQQRKETT